MLKTLFLPLLILLLSSIDNQTQAFEIIGAKLAEKNCTLTGRTELAQRTDLMNTLTTEKGAELQAEVGVLPETSKKYDFFMIAGRHYEDPACDSVKVVNASAVHKKNYVLNPSDGQIYASSFIANKVKYCLKNPTQNDCTSLLANSTLSKDQQDELALLNIKNAKTCSVKTLSKIIKKLPESPQRLTVITCITSLNQNSEISSEELVMELKVLPNSDVDFTLEFSKIYDMN